MFRIGSKPKVEHFLRCSHCGAKLQRGLFRFAVIRLSGGGIKVIPVYFCDDNHAVIWAGQNSNFHDWHTVTET